MFRLKEGVFTWIMKIYPWGEKKKKKYTSTMHENFCDPLPTIIQGYEGGVNLHF